MIAYYAGMFAAAGGALVVGFSAAWLAMDALARLVRRVTNLTNRAQTNEGEAK